MLDLSKQISETDLNINQFNIWKDSRHKKDIVLIIIAQSNNCFHCFLQKRNFKVGLYFEVIWFQFIFVLNYLIIFPFLISLILV